MMAATKNRFKFLNIFREDEVPPAPRPPPKKKIKKIGGLLELWYW